jgi:predicted permease
MHLWFVALIGITVPRRLRADWQNEWEAELHHREALLANWEHLGWRNKVDLLSRSTAAFWDALRLQPRRMEEEMFQDLRYGARMLFKNPAFSSLVILTLALGIGANAALFSIVSNVLLSPLPYPHPEQLVTLHQSKPNFETGAIPYPNFRDLQKENRTFSSMAISRRFGFSLLGRGDAERVSGRLVSADYFSVLQINASLGRTFAPGEDQRGASPVAMISRRLWQRKFDSAPEVIGQSLILDDKTYNIIGVLPEDVRIISDADVFVPIGQWSNPALESRAAALGLHGIGRLKEDVTVEQGQADLDRIMRDLAVAYPATNKGNGARVIPMKEFMVGSARPILIMLLGAVMFVLLIACVNVSNLLLARSTGRTREFAIRTALGAGQWRLLRQSLTESTLLACSGGLLGLLLAGWGTQAALGVLPDGLPRAQEVRLDYRVLIFTLAVSLLTGLLSGLAPALKNSQHRLSEALKDGGRGAGVRLHGQGLLVGIEVALALALLIGAGLMIRSMTALWNVNPGFRAENVTTFGLSLPPAMRSASPEKIQIATRDLHQRLNSMPGMRAVSFSTGAAPLQGEDDLFFWLDGQQKPASQSEMNMAVVYRVEPTYLDAMSIPLKLGRFFTEADDERAPSVVVIDEVLARKYFGTANPVGRRLRMDPDKEPLEIIGVVGHVMQWSLDSDSQQSLQAQLYRPFSQTSAGSIIVSAVARSVSNRSVSMESIRRVVQGQYNDSVIFDLQTMNEVIADSLAARRFSTILLNAFALAALLLASLGLYGVISYLVGQRTHELGVRIALGAQRNDVMRLVIGDGMRMALSGVVVGLGASLILTRFISGMLFGVGATDAVTFATITVLLSTVALLACYFPARRATRVDPLVALRHE